MSTVQGALLDYSQPEARASGSEMQNLSARQVWSMLRRHLPMAIGIVALCVAVVLFMQLRLPDQYEATATVQVELNDSNGSNQADSARNQQRVANEARIYRSEALAQQVVRDLKLQDNPVFNGGKPMTEQQATLQLIGRTRVVSTSDSDFIDIVVRSTDPALSALVANHFVESLQELRSNRRLAWRDGLTRALAAESSRLASEVETAERTAAQFRREHNMPIGAGSAEDYQQMNRIGVEEASAAAMNSAAAARAASIASASRMRTTAGATSPVVEQLQRQRDDLQRERSDLSIALGAQHPDRQRIEAQLSQVSRDLDRERTAVISAEQARINADAGREQQLAAGEAHAAAARAGQLQARVAAINAQTFRNNANNVELAALDRRADVARQAYLTTAQRAQSIRAELETTGVNSTMVSAATPPLSRVAPAPVKMAVVAFIGSGVFVLLLIFCLEMFDNRLRSGEQLYRLFGLPTFAMLPLLPRGIAMTTEDNPVVTEPQSLFAEVARTMAGEIDQLRSGGASQSVLVTSPLPGDGKSSVALTMAAAAATMGRRSVVVDLDLRRPGPSVLRAIQATSGTPDLIELLTGTGELRRLLPASTAGEPGAPNETLPVVLGTTEAIANPATIVKGWQLERLMKQLHAEFDLIVINAPAVLAVRDATTLSSFADSTVMVLRWGRTTIEQMRAAMQLLHGRIAGAVVNQVDYAEHARRGYGDAVQFYMGSASYYSDSFGTRGWRDAVRQWMPPRFRRASN